ncbi:uncharacterized protein LOC144448126 [Glandiceps talaboti]
MTDYRSEGKVVLPEMANLLQQLEPVKQLKAVNQLLKEVQLLQRKQQDDLKTALVKYSKVCEEKEEKILGVVDELNKVEMEENVMEKKHVEEDGNLNTASKEYSYPFYVSNLCCYVMQAIEDTGEEGRRLKDLRNNVAEETTETVPQTRFKVDLFQNLLGIQWNYECADNEIKGYVCTGHDVRPFFLNKQQNSDFFITNHLWDLVEAAHKEKE